MVAVSPRCRPPAAVAAPAAAASPRCAQPRRLGSLHELELVPGDVIRVHGACGPDGLRKRPVPRASSIGIGGVDPRLRNMPVHDAADRETWWFGTIESSGRAPRARVGTVVSDEIVDVDVQNKACWPATDTRQRTGRFPQSCVVLREDHQRMTEELTEAVLQVDGESRCTMCDRLMPVPVAGRQKQLDPLLDMCNAGDGVFSNHDICARCASKMVQLVKTVARNALLKPSADETVTSLARARRDKCRGLDKLQDLRDNHKRHHLLNLRGVADDGGEGEAEWRRREEAHIAINHRAQRPAGAGHGEGGPRAQQLRSAYGADAAHRRQEAAEASAVAGALEGEHLVTLTLETGQIGIEFNHECEVQRVRRKTQAFRHAHLACGDVLVGVAGINVRGMTLKEMTTVLAQQPRPVELVFLRHTNWHRGPNGLPKIDYDRLEDLFVKHDKTNEFALTAVRFGAMMSEVHVIASKMLGRDPDDDFFPVELAERLIDAHDSNDDRLLDFEELRQWLQKGLRQTEPERKAYAARGGFCTGSVQFIEEAAVAMQIGGEALLAEAELRIAAQKRHEEEEEAHQLYLMEMEEAERAEESIDVEDVRVIGELEKKHVGPEGVPLPKLTHFEYEFDGEGAPLGVQFSHMGVVTKIAPGSQASDCIRLARGDALDAIDGEDVRALSFLEIRPLMAKAASKGKYTLRFEHHMDWSRGSSGLPYIDFDKLDRLFDCFDPARVGSMGAEELALFWDRVHDMALRARGHAPGEDRFEALQWAQALIDAHDEDDSGRLDREEIVTWVARDALLSMGERAVLAARGGYAPASVRFVEDVAYGVAKHMGTAISKDYRKRLGKRRPPVKPLCMDQLLSIEAAEQELKSLNLRFSLAFNENDEKAEAAIANGEPTRCEFDVDMRQPFGMHVDHVHVDTRRQRRKKAEAAAAKVAEDKEWPGEDALSNETAVGKAAADEAALDETVLDETVLDEAEHALGALHLVFMMSRDLSGTDPVMFNVDLADHNGMGMGIDHPEGAFGPLKPIVVSRVLGDSQAERAGVEAGMYIVEINGVPLRGKDMSEVKELYVETLTNAKRARTVMWQGESRLLRAMREVKEVKCFNYLAVVTRVLPGMQAEAAGVKVGMRVRAVDGNTCESLPMPAVLAMYNKKLARGLNARMALDRLERVRRRAEKAGGESAKQSE